MGLTISLLPVGCAVVTYPYRVVDGGCNCEEYFVTDSRDQVEYRFHGRYRMEGGIATTIDVELGNLGGDTLLLDLAVVKISSTNVPYQYNDKFLPLPPLVIPPGDREVLHLEGKSVGAIDDWKIIAGERLTVTLKGIRRGSRTLADATVTFVPENPQLRNN